MYTASQLYDDYLDNSSTSNWPYTASDAIPPLSDFSCEDPAPSMATSSSSGNPDVDDIFVWNALSHHFGQQTSSVDPNTLFHHKDEVHCTPGSFSVRQLGSEEAASRQEQFAAWDASSGMCNYFRPETDHMLKLILRRNLAV